MFLEWLCGIIKCWLIGHKLEISHFAYQQGYHPAHGTKRVNNRSFILEDCRRCGLRYWKEWDIKPDWEFVPLRHKTYRYEDSTGSYESDKPFDPKGDI